MRRAVPVAVLLTLAGAARADDKERAASAFAEARSALARGNFQEAAAAFEQAATLSPHPAVLLDAAEAWELAHDPLRAADACDRALALTPLEARYRDAAAGILTRVGPKVVTIVVRGEIPGAVDGAPVVPPKTIRVAPGVHTLDRGPGATPRIVRRAFDAGESVTLDVVSAPARTSEAAPPERASRPPIAAFAAFGVALVAAGAAAYFAVQVKGAQDDFDRTPTPGTRDGFYRARTATNVSAAVAVAAAAVGVVAWTVKF